MSQTGLLGAGSRRDWPVLKKVCCEDPCAAGYPKSQPTFGTSVKNMIRILVSRKPPRLLDIWYRWIGTAVPSLKEDLPRRTLTVPYEDAVVFWDMT